MIPVAEAIERIARACEPLGEEDLRLAEAAGRTLAREIAADADYPSFDTTAMDGYAIRTGTGLPGPNRFRERAGAVAAGAAVPPPLGDGEAVRVMTGAPIPEGTGAIVPVEDARVDSDGVTLTTPKPGAHIRSRGEVFRKGDLLLSAGTRLSPEAVLLCATVGFASVPVWRLPRCVAAATGEEIVPAGSTPRIGQIRNGNTPALVAALSLRGIRSSEFQAVSDRSTDLEAFFSEGGDSVDIILTTGGVSAGDFDLTAKAAEAAGFEILFHGVSIKPGKPIAFGRRGRTIWFGLPGNPVSAMTSFEVFVAAALDRLDGRPARTPVLAKLTAPVRHRPGLVAYRDGLLSWEGNGLLVEPLKTRGSHDILCQARRNALVIIPSEDGDHREGDLLACLPLREITA